MIRLLVISPVRDEEAHVRTLARSVAVQTRPPDRWLVVDDGSKDGTLELARAAAGEHAFLRVLQAPPARDGADSESRLGRAAEIRAFNWALEQVGLDRYTHVAKVDGDIELPPDYFERVLREFEHDPSLGVAGGRFAERHGDGWRTVRIPDQHVPGALKVYRRDCLEAIGGVREHLGWDTIDETTARMRGFTTRSLPDLVARHHRPMGSVGGRLRGRARYGACAYAAGYPAPWVVLRSLKVALQSPRGLSGAAFLSGYVRAALGPLRHDRDDELCRFVRRELTARLTGPLYTRAGRRTIPSRP
jgi:glycosyltransferase involved in cell wall biosynthesis